MTYLAQLKRRISSAAPECEATKVSEGASVPFVAPVSAGWFQNSGRDNHRTRSAHPFDRHAFEERAGIMEHDGGLSRREAEELAAKAQGFTLTAIRRWMN